MFSKDKFVADSENDILYQNIKNTFLTVYNFADRVAAVEKLSGRKSLFMRGKAARNKEKDILYQNPQNQLELLDRMHGGEKDNTLIFRSS